ncbi:hypothetical protein FACS1894107_00590 [Planctomycetales bacterium]|nr:hypothetical protein FACS1894107_00590 [Planctomycetales bacterium]
MAEPISLPKAERLFWLGRYTQRVYAVLHFFRKFRDVIIDVDAGAYCNFCDLLGIENRYASSRDFFTRFLFDRDDGSSLISALISAHDNALVLREEIKSETLAFIQMAIAHVDGLPPTADVVRWQIVGDYMLAFLGAVEERIRKPRVRELIEIGWHLESFDLHLRLNYAYDRLLDLRGRLERRLLREPELFDQQKFVALKEEMALPLFDKSRALTLAGQLFRVDNG